MKKMRIGLHGFSLLIMATILCVYFISMAAVARTAMFKEQNGVIYRGVADGVALVCKVTWDAASTEDIMRVADDAGVSVTFFVTAEWVKENIGLINGMSARHGFAMLGDAQNEDELLREIKAFEGLGLNSDMYMPMDDADADKLLPLAKRCGVRVVLSSMDVLGRSTNAMDAVSRVKDDWFDGAIIRFEPTKLMSEALPDVISALQEYGAHMRLLKDLLGAARV